MKNISENTLMGSLQTEKWSQLQWHFQLSGFAIVYLMVAEFGHWLSLPTPIGVATFWPASGLYLAVLLQNPRQRWPVLIIVAFAANLVSDFLLQD